MPCRWKKQGFSSGEDCVAKMIGKVDDPEAFCYGEAESMRHADFRRILDEFNKYYCKDTLPCSKGESEYYQWLKDLNLDENQAYGASSESFKWAKNMLQYLREDDQYKYYKVLIGFPIRSMNGNVYKERDLIAAALTLKGIHPSLNHKDEWHFTPDSRWGEITTEDARFEDGSVEAVLRVSKSSVCPICDGKPMTELIDSKRIVNVSLQGGCARARFGGVCDGFQFDDKGFSLLTSDVLPGIPMARIFPLESIMVEALQVDETKNKRRKRNVTKVKMKVVEQTTPVQPSDEEPCPEGQHRDPDTGKCVADTEEQVPTVDITPQTGPGMRQLRPKAVEPDEHGQCPEGYIQSTQLGQCILDESCPEGQHFDQALQQCVADTVPKPETPETAVGTPAAPKEDVLDPDMPKPTMTGGPLSPPPTPPMPPSGEPAPEAPATLPAPETPGEIEPKPSHTCPDGQHYDYDANQCVPDEPIVERVKRFKAEDKASSLTTQVAIWEKRYIALDGNYRQLLGRASEQQRTISKLEKQIDQFNVMKVQDEVKLKEWHRRVTDLTVSRDGYQQQAEKLKATNEGLNKKYHDTLSTNLELSRKLTKSHEDYLKLASEKELLEARLKKAKRLGKLTVKV